MKKLLILTPLISTLISCSYFENDLTLLCKGTLHITQNKFVNGEKGDVITDTVEKNYEKVFKFENKSYGVYKCEWSKEIIRCRRQDDKDGVKIDNYLRVDRLTGNTVTLDEMWSKSTKTYYVDDFQGVCEKSKGNKI